MAAQRTIDIAARINGRKLGPFNYRLIILSWLIIVFDGFDMMMISFTAPYMRDELGLNTTMLGDMFSAGLASGLPIIRSFVILAVCPLVLALCAPGIAHFAPAPLRLCPNPYPLPERT